jgi:hypothetical protein
VIQGTPVSERIICIAVFSSLHGGRAGKVGPLGLLGPEFLGLDVPSTTGPWT